MSALDELVEQVHLMASKIRDENRPSMEFAAACIDDLVKRAIAGAAVGTRMFPAMTGPDRWSWVSENGSRELSIYGSALPEAIGHPLMTMREMICPPLDTQVTTSALLVGLTNDQVSASALTLLTNHAAAVAGISAVSRKNVLEDDIAAEIDRIEGNVPEKAPEIEVFEGKLPFGKDDGSMN